MESAEREVLRVLLARLFELGLLSEATYRSATEQVCSAAEPPDFFRRPAPEKGA